MENQYVVEVGALGSNVVMFEPGVIDYDLKADSFIVYDPESEVEEFEEVIVPGVGPMLYFEDLVMYEPEEVKVSGTTSEDSEVQELNEDGSYTNMDCSLQAEFDTMYDPDMNREVESGKLPTNIGCGIGSTQCVDDLVVYEPEGVQEEEYSSDGEIGDDIGSTEYEDDLDVNEPEGFEGVEYPSDSEIALEYSDEISEAEPDSSDKASNQMGEIVYNGRPRRGRKRKVPNQSRADRKRLHNTNKTHINTKGNVCEEKLFDYQFKCLCLKKCTKVVPAHDRLRLFSQFWNVGTYDGRCAYLMSCVKEVNKKRSYSEQNLKNRGKSRIYSIYGTIVCQKTFLKTLNISVTRVTLALEKYMKRDTLADLRGKTTGGWNALPPSKIAEVCAHIASFPRYVSHYTRAKTESKYLGADLNLAKIYDLYKADAENPVSQSTYNQIFWTNFNLRFKPPKKDTCQKCDIYENKRKRYVGDDLRILDEWHENHLDHGESLQAQMKADCLAAKNDPELECLTYDMQKTLQLPKITTGIAYYKRQLNLYNFGIHSGSTRKGYFNLWTEDEASKGTQEVGSCLKAHIESIPERVKNLILWSDSCGGQNRSIKLVLMIKHILHNSKTLVSISMRYLLSGHSFLPNDTEFGEVETASRRKEALYTDEAYMEVMKECRKKNLFTVNRMSPENFFSVQGLEALITNRKVDLKNKKVSWLDTHEILLEKKNPNAIKMRNKISGPFQMVNISKLGRELDMQYITLSQLWPTGRPLSKDKIKDLKDLIGLVPEEYHYFYDRLNRVEGADFQDDIDGFGMSIDFDPDPQWT